MKDTKADLAVSMTEKKQLESSLKKCRAISDESFQNLKQQTEQLQAQGEQLAASRQRQDDLQEQLELARADRKKMQEDYEQKLEVEAGRFMELTDLKNRLIMEVKEHKLTSVMYLQQLKEIEAEQQQKQKKTGK